MSRINNLVVILANLASTNATSLRSQSTTQVASSNINLAQIEEIDCLIIQASGLQTSGNSGLDKLIGRYCDENWNLDNIASEISEINEEFNQIMSALVSDPSLGLQYMAKIEELKNEKKNLMILAR